MVITSNAHLVRMYTRVHVRAHTRVSVMMFYYWCFSSREIDDMSNSQSTFASGVFLEY